MSINLIKFPRSVLKIPQGVRGMPLANRTAVKCVCFLLTASMFFSALCFSSYNPEDKPFDLAVSLGLLGGGSFQGSWDSDFPAATTLSENTVPSFMGMAIYDYYILPYLSVGGALTYAAIIPQSDIDWYDDGEHHINMNDIFIMDYCVGIKYRKVFNDLFAVKPGLYLGIRNSFSHSWEAREIGMALDGSLEFQLFIRDNLYTFIDLGFLSQPYGGVVNIAYVRGGPIYYFTVGFGI